MKKIILFIALIVIALSLVFYGFGAKNVNAKFGKRSAPEILVTKVKTKKIQQEKNLSGRVVAAKISEVRPQISGVIKRRIFEEGSFVEAGEQLYQIDASPFLANFESALANLKVSEANFLAVRSRFKRYQELVKVGAISKQEFDDLKAQFEQAEADIAIKEAALRNAQIELDYTKVLAPISGKIGKSFVSEGGLITASQAQALAVITQLDPIYVDISQPSSEFVKMNGLIKDGQEVRVEVSIPNYDENYKKIGSLSFAESIIDESTGSIALRAIFDNEDSMLLPGLFVRAKIILGRKEKVTIAQNVVKINLDGSKSVFVVDKNNVVLPRQIKASQTYGNEWIVESGLQKDEIIVSEGFQKIAPNMKISPLFEEQIEVRKNKKAALKKKIAKEIGEIANQKLRGEKGFNVAETESYAAKNKPVVAKTNSTKLPELKKEGVEYDDEIKKYISEKIKNSKKEFDEINLGTHDVSAAEVEIDDAVLKNSTPKNK